MYNNSDRLIASAELVETCPPRSENTRRVIIYSGDKFFLILPEWE